MASPFVVEAGNVFIGVLGSLSGAEPLVRRSRQYLPGPPAATAEGSPEWPGECSCPAEEARHSEIEPGQCLAAN
eukprot:4408206-Lingulodinium_polyedra.AAC.1